MSRSLEDLRSECNKLGISWSHADSKAGLVNKLRARLAAWAADIPDPMKAKNLQDLVEPASPRPYAAFRPYFDKTYVAEPKFDGARMMMILGSTENMVVSPRRSVKTFAATSRTDNFPHFRDAVVPTLAGTILDGELLAPSPKLPTKGGFTDSILNASVALVNQGAAGAVSIQQRYGLARFYAFDVTMMLGEDIKGADYDERREVLEVVVAELRNRYPSLPIELVNQYPVTEGVIAAAIEDGYEGVVIKNRHTTYRPGSRSGGWYKVKQLSTADGFITGWETGKGSNAGKVGSVEVSVYRDGDIIAVAQVGNLTDELRDLMTSPSGSLRAEWYRQVLEFAGQGITKGGKVRHPRLVRLRPDKSPLDCQADQLDGWTRV